MKTLRKRSWAAAWGVVAWGLIVCDGNAWAQGLGPVNPAPAPSASAQAGTATQEAEKHYDAGVGLVRVDKWAEALEEFRQAYAASTEPKYLAALIKAETATGRDSDAASHLVTLLRRKSELDADTVAQAEEKLAYLQKRIGTATLKVNIEGAEVLVDGVAVGTSPIKDEVFVNAGRRTFQARKDGFVTAEESVQVAAGSKLTVALGLKKAERPGGEKGGGPNKALVYTGIVVASALAAVGVGTAIGAAMAEQKSEDDWKQANCNTTPTPVCYSNFDEQEDKRFLLGNTAVWTFVGATAVGVGTLVYAVTAKKPDSPSQTQAVYVEPTVGGVMVRGTF